MDYIFNLSEKDVQIIFQGLGELHLKLGVETFGKLCMQKDAQEKASNGVQMKQPPGEHSQSQIIAQN